MENKENNYNNKKSSSVQCINAYLQFLFQCLIQGVRSMGIAVMLVCLCLSVDLVPHSECMRLQVLLPQLVAWDPGSSLVADRPHEVISTSTSCSYQSLHWGCRGFFFFSCWVTKSGTEPSAPHANID